MIYLWHVISSLCLLQFQIYFTRGVNLSGFFFYKETDSPLSPILHNRPKIEYSEGKSLITPDERAGPVR